MKFYNEIFEENSWGLAMIKLRKSIRRIIGGEKFLGLYEALDNFDSQQLRMEFCGDFDTFTKTAIIVNENGSRLSIVQNQAFRLSRDKLFIKAIHIFGHYIPCNQWAKKNVVFKITVFKDGTVLVRGFDVY